MTHQLNCAALNQEAFSQEEVARTEEAYQKCIDLYGLDFGTQYGWAAAVEELSPSVSTSASMQLTAPSTAGTYYYGACVDAVADESNTTNNCSLSVQVTGT